MESKVGDDLRCGFAVNEPMYDWLEESIFQANLDRDGSNFSSWYRHMLLEHQELVQDYTGALSEVIEGFKFVRLEQVGKDTRSFKVVMEGVDDRYELRLDEISDGERALIVLYALLHITAGQGYTLFLDEPDNYVALAEIQPWLMGLADACGDAIPQAVICSHHPELIDYLGDDRARLLGRDGSGAVTVRPLDSMKLEDDLRLSERVARGWER